MWRIFNLHSCDYLICSHHRQLGFFIPDLQYCGVLKSEDLTIVDA